MKSNTHDCSTDFIDLAAYAMHWLETDCNIPNNWCGGADLNHNNNVDGDDLSELAHLWLASGLNGK